MPLPMTPEQHKQLVDAYHKGARTSLLVHGRVRAQDFFTYRWLVQGGIVGSVLAAHYLSPGFSVVVVPLIILLTILFPAGRIQEVFEWAPWKTVVWLFNWAGMARLVWESVTTTRKQRNSQGYI